jgi:RNA polymerase sigma factor (sigma-70 family)
MQTPPAAPDFGLPGNPGFPSTHWSVVWAAVDSCSPSSAGALEHLCAAYWYPLYVFARRMGRQVEEAQDLVQGFFLEFLEKKWLRQVDPGRGRLRTFLLACFRNFQSNEWRKDNAAKRGQGRIESLEALLRSAEDRYRFEPRDEVDPAALYDRLWILGIVDRALRRLAAEFNEIESAKRFAVLQQFLPGRRPALSQAEAGAQLGLSENAMNQAVFKMRRRLREILREEIAGTCASPGDFEDELRFVLAQWSV